MSNAGGILGNVWREDPAIHGLGCGSHSCKYLKPTGMGTNGPCMCSQNHSRNVERFLLRNLAHMKSELDKLKLEVEIDQQLRGINE